MEEPPKKKVKVTHEDSKTSTVSLSNLPREILCTIFSHLDQKSVKNSTGTCKLWFELIRGNSNLSSGIKIVKLQEIERIKAMANKNLRLSGKIAFSLSFQFRFWCTATTSADGGR